jgi:acetyl-CoA synthetase
VSAFPFDQPVAWTPDPSAVAETNLARFWTRLGLSSYAELQAWALADVGRFWDAALADLGIEFSTPYSEILDTSGGLERPQWCAGGRMNVTHNALDRYAGTPTWAQDAIRYEREEGGTEAVTYAELARRVGVFAAALRGRGIGPGDAVGILMPMTPEIVVATLAVVRIGAVVLPLFSGYGAEAVRQRLDDGGAVALVTSDGLPRRGRAVALKATADEALASLPDVRLVVVHERMGADRLGGPAPMTPGRDVLWFDFAAEGERMATPETTGPHDTSAEDRALLLYTSGTTGAPKGAVHTHVGFPVKAAQDMRHAFDVRPGDVVWWMSDMGWMMGPWLVFGSLLCGATMVLYDGAPDAAPDGSEDAGRTWRIAAAHGVTLLGLSPSLVRALMPHGPAAVAEHDLSRLRAAGSTGSPWDPESWRWLFEHVLTSEKPILNYSGGTEISGGIVCGNFVEPVKPCGFPGPVVGMDADILGDDGQPVRGAVGELVVRQPWIGMTRGFHDGAAPGSGERRYHAAYWAQRPGIWTHGDFAAVDADGQWFILGRSDDTIKVAGKRLGPAEVEAVLNANPAVAESAAIGVPDRVKGEAVVALVVLAPRVSPTETLRDHLREALVGALGKALAPRAVLFTTALPKTRNGKIMRRVARAAYLGEPVGNVVALESEAGVEAVRNAD